MNSAQESAEYAHASEYYARADVQRVRTHSTSSRAAGMSAEDPQDAAAATQRRYQRRRRTSHDEKPHKPRKFLIDVETTKRLILEQEDTDGDLQITVNDAGPKVIKVGTADSGGINTFDIRGTYMLSNLLQELALASGYGRRHIVIDEARLNENPVNRLSRMIRHHFWDGLTRRIDADGLELICNDPKNRGSDQRPRIYVPYGDPDAWEYYSAIAADRPHLNLQVERLPADITPEWVNSINDRPGILALATRRETDADGHSTLAAVPFVVPGGRFNEMYGWDSYFEALGLLADGRVELARGMVDNFVYQIEHYGKILNANRSYYLTRSQPPFLTDMALKVYERLPVDTPDENLVWLTRALRAAFKEYHTVWMAAPRLDPVTGLSCYHTTGIGMPPETEASHFDHVVEPYAHKRGLSIEEFASRYNSGSLSEPELDEYFVHDRAVRESGHDTTYRLEKRCAHLATIDLNALLYRYEVDLATAVRDLYHDRFPLANGTIVSSATYFACAERRRAAIDRYCWNAEEGLYFDYDTRRHTQSNYESVTALWALWAGVASAEQAALLVASSLRRFEVTGGLVCGTEGSRGAISLDRPNRQWDYPYGWAPHQMLAWRGLEAYGYMDVARRLSYRWLYTITKSFVDFNGVVPEKFDVVAMTHLVKVEYGNVGIDFKLVPREGFGWMNASYQIGLTYLTSHMRRALGALTHPDLFARSYTDRLLLSSDATITATNTAESATDSALSE